MTALPDVLLPYQQRLWQAIDASALSVHEKSRRTGFSWALGAVAAATAGAARSAGGQDVLYMGYEKDMTREFIGYVAEWAKAFQVAAGEVQEFLFTDPENPDKSVGAFRIRFASGFEVIALPSVARALRGKQGLVILDEAAFMDDLEAVLKAALALLIWGGKVVVVSTHFGEENPFNGLINDIRAGRTRGAVTRTTFDEALAEGLYRRICLRLGRAWSAEAEAKWRQEILDTYRDNADEELNVIPNPTSGVYLPRVLVEARCVPDVPVVRWTAPKGFTLWAEHIRVAEALAFCERELLPVLSALHKDEAHALGSDFGRVRDLTVDWLLAIGRDLVRRPRLVLELREVPHEQQRQILFYILDRAPKLRAVKLDAGGNGSYIAEATLQRYGECVEPVQLSELWYREHMPRWKAAIEDAAMLLPRDREIVDDHCMVKLVRGIAKIPDRRRTAAGEQRHGDAAIASALAYAASEAEVMEYGYEGAMPSALKPPASNRWRDRPNHNDDVDAQPSGRGWMPEMRGGLML
jgi:phage FluMu gp28-like protein